ncbi:hypothetical protein GCM10023220_44540 [Streptomyces ziwulingensis]|uniref:Uncharacterized protein n=1 Tax=Streptomyces ziwulingensis TaxID=1045501 RepID=A0ABP9CEX9_9ACTN
MHVQVDQGGEFPGQELHMDAGAPVDVRRVLPGQQSHTHPEPPLSTTDHLMVTYGGRGGKSARGRNRLGAGRAVAAVAVPGHAGRGRQRWRAESRIGANAHSTY